MSTTNQEKRVVKFMSHASERRGCYTHSKFFSKYRMVFYFMCQRSCEWNVQKSKLAFFLFPCRMVTFNKYLKQKTKKRREKGSEKIKQCVQKLNQFANYCLDFDSILFDVKENLRYFRNKSISLLHVNFGISHMFHTYTEEHRFLKHAFMLD